MKKSNKKESQNILKFDTERTNIWISFCFEIFFVIIPFLAIWILIGNFWNSNSYHNYYDFLPYKQLMVFIICIAYLFLCIVFNFISYLVKIQKEDSFTFTIAIALICFGFIVNDLWILAIFESNNSLTWVIRFILIAVFGCAGIFIGTFVSSLIRNHRFKIEEENEEILMAHESGEDIPSIASIRLKKALNYRQKKQKEKHKLDEFKKQLNKNLTKEIQDEKISRLNAKEQKKRERKLKNKN